MQFVTLENLPRERWFILYLNDMRSSQIQIVVPVFKSRTREGIENLLKECREKEEWKDGDWRKSFKKGSPLEWYNPFEGGMYGGIREVPSVYELALIHANNLSRELDGIAEVPS